MSLVELDCCERDRDVAYFESLDGWSFGVDKGALGQAMTSRIRDRLEDVVARDSFLGDLLVLDISDGDHPGAVANDDVRADRDLSVRVEIVTNL